MLSVPTDVVPVNTGPIQTGASLALGIVQLGAGSFYGRRQKEMASGSLGSSSLNKQQLPMLQYS